MAMYVLQSPPASPTLYLTLAQISRNGRFYSRLPQPRRRTKRMVERTRRLVLANISNTPITGYTKMVYGDGTKLVGFSALDVGHSVPIRAEDDLACLAFGFDGYYDFHKI